MFKQMYLLAILYNICCIQYLEGVNEECRILRKAPSCPENVFYKPWPNDAECKIYTVGFPKWDDSWEPTALALFPASGDSGIGQLIQEVSGKYVSHLVPTLITYDIKENDETNSTTEFCLIKSTSTHQTIIQRTMGSFYDLAPTWVFKNRGFSSQDISLKDLSTITFDYRGILFVRNPWISISEFRLKLRRAFRGNGCQQCVSKSIKRTLGAERDFEEKDFQDFMEQAAIIWVDSMKAWISKSPHGSELIIIEYEDFVKDPAPELTRVMKYLNVPVNEGRLKCALKYASTIVNKRVTLPFETRTAVSHQLKNFKLVNQILTDGILEVNKLLQQRGIKKQLNYTQP